MDVLLEILHGELSTALRGLEKIQTQRRPLKRPEGWTIGEIVEHLRLTYAATDRVVTERMAKGRATKARPSIGQWIGQMAVTGVGYFPRARMAPPSVMPKEAVDALSGDELGLALGEDLKRMDVLLADAERVLGRGRTVTHVILGPMSIGQWRRFHLAHGRHHAKQIRAIARETAGGAPDPWRMRLR